MKTNIFVVTLQVNIDSTLPRARIRTLLTDFLADDLGEIERSGVFTEQLTELGDKSGDGPSVEFSVYEVQP